MRKAFLILIFVFASFSVFATITPSDRKIRTNANELGVPFEDLKLFVKQYHRTENIDKPDFVFSNANKVREFCAENESNSYSFFLKYKDACVELHDVEIAEAYSSYDTYNWDYAYEIKGKVPGFDGYMFILLSETEDSKVSKIKTGATVSVRGFIRENRSYVQLYNAVLI